MEKKNIGVMGKVEGGGWSGEPHQHRLCLPASWCALSSSPDCTIVFATFMLNDQLMGAHDSELLDMDLHRLDATDDQYLWHKVDTIGDRAIFVADNCVVMSPAPPKQGIRPDCVYLLYQRCRDGVRLYTIRLDDRTTLRSPLRCARLHDPAKALCN
uniref:KIB1-4 beta-propeller domain-containing protein n=1 Tax=Oryza punctata TaxID=4537 RepID=A0A0E0LQ17_ORYPU